MEVLDALVGKETLTAAEADYLAVLSDLVEQYEAGTHPIPPASDAELLQHLLEARSSLLTALPRPQALRWRRSPRYWTGRSVSRGSRLAC